MNRNRNGRTSSLVKGASGPVSKNSTLAAKRRKRAASSPVSKKSTPAAKRRERAPQPNSNESIKPTSDTPTPLLNAPPKLQRTKQDRGYNWSLFESFESSGDDNLSFEPSSDDDSFVTQGSDISFDSASEDSGSDDNLETPVKQLHLPSELLLPTLLTNRLP